VQLEWLVQMSKEAKAILLTSELIMCSSHTTSNRSIGAVKADMHCVLSATWPISDNAAAVQVFKAQLLNQHDILSPSAQPAQPAGTATATPSTSMQVCQASLLQNLHFTWILCLLAGCHVHCTWCVKETHNVCFSDFKCFALLQGQKQPPTPDM